MHVVFVQLIPLRDFLCNHLVRLMRVVFPSFKDSELIDAVIEAYSWHELWVFISIFLVRVLGPLESARRWGLVCPYWCHGEQRELHPKKRFECYWNPRRLTEARKFIAQLCAKLMQEGRALYHIKVAKVCFGSSQRYRRANAQQAQTWGGSNRG